MKRYLLAILTVAIPVMVCISCNSEKVPPYKNPDLPIDQRVEDLLGRMTLEEKFWQMIMVPRSLEELNDPNTNDDFSHGAFGFSVDDQSRNKGNAAEQMLDYSAGMNGTAMESAETINALQKYFVEKTRLGIPLMMYAEALHGLIKGGATAFPQSIALAATWDTTLVRKVGLSVSQECRSRGFRDILSPVVNIANDVRWGRTEETYGEDPYLSSRIGVAYVAPFESNGVITTPKHYIANVGDGGRDSYPINFNERLLRETYLPPFKACFEEAGSRSVMTAYNTWDGTACSSNSYLLRDILKDEIGFKGFVISDAGAVGGANVLHMTASGYEEATQQAITGGLDVIFQTAYDHINLFYPAFEKGLIDMKDIDDAVRRVLRAKFELGLFENPYVDVQQAGIENNSPEKREICREAARESFVLLKNENEVLPIDKSKIKSIALIGGEIKAARLGGYSGPGCNKISIYDGISEYLEGTGVKVNYAMGAHYRWSEHQTVSGKYLSYEGKPGVHGVYYANDTFEGEPAVVRQEGSIDFRWTLFSPDPDKIPYDCYSATWTGNLKAPKTGTFDFGIEGNDGYRMWIDGELFIDNWGKKSYGKVVKPFSFVKDKEYSIKIDYHETSGNAWLKLIWNADQSDPSWQSLIAEAVNVARNSDIAVVAVGIHEGEFQDRALLSLPGKQIELINAVKATGRPVVVLLVGGSAITFSGWADGVSSVLDIWYPGETGGQAVADVLFGDYSPSGKLPITFPVHEGQLPLVYNHRPTGRGDDYHNLTGQPLFPFGYGLSYTQFEYSNLAFSDKTMTKDGKITVSFDLKNVGKYAGAEVAQLYVRDVLSSVSQPVKQLRDFQKVFLNPGETKRLEFAIDSKTLQMLDGNLEWTVEPGEFRIMIGTSSMDIRLRDNITVVE